MGIVIRIDYFPKWGATYFVQTLIEQEAKERAFRMFKQEMSCYLPDTIEGAEQEECFLLEVVARVDCVLF